MSHVATIDLQIKDLDALAEACKALGLEFVKGKQTYNWYGHHVGDYPIPSGFKVSDLGKCDHAIRIPGNSQAYEIGVVKNRAGEGYVLLWDFWAGGQGMVAKVGNNATKLKDHYGAALATKQLKKQGYRVKQTVDALGKITVKGW